MCTYTGHEFGASYPDSVCIDGFLWDADSGDDDGLTHGGDIPCPRCNTAEYLDGAKEEAGCCGMSGFTPWCGAVVFEAAARKALSENADAAKSALSAMAPFEAEDWPDRQAVYDRRARWDDTVSVMVQPAVLGEGEK